MADKKPYDSIIDALLDEREPDWKGLDLEAERKSGEEVLARTHDFVDTGFIDEIAESASEHTPVWSPKSGSYERRIAEKETAAPRVNAVKADWRKDARRDQDAYNTRMGDNDSLIGEVTMTLEQAGRGGNLKENTADKKEVSDAQVQKYVRDLLNQGAAPAKVAAQLKKLAEIELFNHQSATDYLQRNAGLLGLAYLEPNTYMDKNSPTYERQAGKTADLQQGMTEQYPQGEKVQRESVNWEDMTPEEKAEEAEYQRKGFERNPHHGASSNECVKQHAAWKNAGVKPQARSVKQIRACEGCSYFKKGASGKQCNLYHLPVVANTAELAQIVNHLTPGVPEKRKHAALVGIANGEDRRVQNTVVASQTNVVKTADAKVRNQGKRASYEFKDERETSGKFASDHVAKMHEKGASLAQIYKWASGKFGDVDVSIAFRGFVQTLRKDAKGKIAVASKDLEFLNSIGIRNAAFEGGAKCASCSFHKQALMSAVNPLDEQEGVKECSACGNDPSSFAVDEEGVVFCAACGEQQPVSQDELRGWQRVTGSGKFAARVGQKFASKTPDAVRGRQAEAKAVTVTPAKVRTLHQAGHSIERIYSGVASKVGSLQAKKAVAGFVEGMIKAPGKVAVSEADRVFLGKLGFRHELVRQLRPQRPATQVVASVPDDVHVLGYPGMEKQAGEKKATDGHSILAEYDLHNAAEMPDIDTGGREGEEIQMNDSFRMDID